MRVLLVTNNPRWEGTEAHIASLAASFKDAPAFRLFAAVFRRGVLVDKLKESGVPVHVIPVRYPFDVTAIWRLAHLMNRWRIDILHTHGYKANVIGALAARLARVPAIVRTMHGLPEPFRGLARLKMDFYLWLDKKVGRHLTDAVIAVSEDVEEVARQQFSGVPIFRIHNAISRDGDRRGPRKEALEALALPAEVPLVGIVGRLAPVKDHATFLSAAQRVLLEDARAHFVVAGSGPLQPELEAFAMTLGIRDRVHFRYIPNGAQPVLDAIDVLVFSSRHEGVPYALLEGLRSGVPVVATAVGGFAEILTDGENALLVPPQNPDALAKEILRLLWDKELANGLASRGYGTLEKRFSPQAMRRRTAEVYAYLARLIARRRGIVTGATEFI